MRGNSEPRGDSTTTISMVMAVNAGRPTRSVDKSPFRPHRANHATVTIPMAVHKIENVTHRNIFIESKGSTQCEPHVAPDTFQNGGSHARPPTGNPVSNQPRQSKKYCVEHARGTG